jgi:hypothetical protein
VAHVQSANQEIYRKVKVLDTKPARTLLICTQVRNVL